MCPLPAKSDEYPGFHAGTIGRLAVGSAERFYAHRLLPTLLICITPNLRFVSLSSFGKSPERRTGWGDLPHPVLLSEGAGVLPARNPSPIPAVFAGMGDGLSMKSGKD